MNIVPTEHIPVSGDSFKLEANEKGMSWCLDRLKKDIGRKTKALSIFQSVPLYYAALAVKHEHKMTVAARNAAVARAYKYTAPAFLAYLQEQHDFQVPSWLTIAVMGCTTLSAQGEKEQRYFDPKGDTAWKRYVEIQKQIRARWNPWVKDYLVNSQSSPQKSLPSYGTQEKDVWENLHLFLFQEANAGKKMKREDYLRRLEEGEELEIVEQETKDAREAQVADAGESPSGEQEQIPENQASGSLRFEVVDKQDDVGDTVTVRDSMPDSWLHAYSLVFACFGHFADHPEPDLELSLSDLSDGPLDETSVQDADESDEGLDSSETDSLPSRKRKTLRRRSYPDEALSREGQKKHKKQNEVKETRTTAITARLAHAIERSFDGACEKAAVAAMQEVVKGLRAANRLRERSIAYAEKDKVIGWMGKEIQVLKGMGDEKRARVAQRQLLELLRAPVLVETPWGHAGRDRFCQEVEASRAQAASPTPPLTQALSGTALCTPVVNSG